MSMNSFIFPEDLDPGPVRIRRVEQQPPPPVSKSLEQAFPTPSIRRRPVPIILPTDVDFSKYLNPQAVPQKSKDEVVVSITRMSLDERSPRLQKPNAPEKRPSNLTRWKSATLSKSEKEDREVRMALAEADRLAQRQARLDRAAGNYRQHRGGLAPLQEERRDGRGSPADYGVTHLAF